jgi:hypothetical protein
MINSKIVRLYLYISLSILSGCKTADISYRAIYDSMDKYRTLELIRLDKEKSYNRTLQFENINSVIYFSAEEFLDYACKKLKDSICLPKKTALSQIISLINAGEDSYYLLEKEIKPKEFRQFHYPGARRYQKNFVEPYGYNVFSDTIKKTKIIELKYWMISDMCLEGKCKVLDKRGNNYMDSIYFQIIDFKDGHGGESLHFADMKLFFNVKVYSDVAWPDFDCMSLEDYDKWEISINGSKRTK